MLGGSPTKEDYVLKSTLIEIIKMEFELTIDMEVSLVAITLLKVYLLANFNVI